MATIDVRQSGSGTTLAFDVTVDDSGSSSTHQVTVDPPYFKRLSRSGETPEAFVERCFEFLLAREPRDSILASFDVSVIARYFPDFEEQIAR